MKAASQFRLLAFFMFMLRVAGDLHAQYPSAPQVAKDGTAVLLQDWVFAPLSSRTPNSGYNYSFYPPSIDYADQIGRVNFLRAEPTNAPLAATRYFVCDMNRNLYILDRTNGAFTAYIDFEATFPKFDNNPGFAGGLVTVLFHPGYVSNGLFYTVHTENPNKGGSEPVNPNAVLPSGYTNTAVEVPPAGTIQRHGVLVEWHDTNITNASFEGAARELLRVGFTGTIHPMGDLAFNPLAQPGDWDYSNLYIANGDGGAGETAGATHTIPQNLKALVGKILRITPDVDLRPADLLSSNGTYRIPATGPAPNPFTATNSVFTNLAAARPEVFAYGFRNPHRLSWDEQSDTLLVDDIGYLAWEEINIVYRGTNYGYAEREGVEQLFISSNGSTNGKTGSQFVTPIPFPTNTDFLVVTGLVSAVEPTYPVAAYSHLDGEAISSGFVYRGNLLPQLRGKYIFGDIPTARIFYCDFDELRAADDGVRTSVATIHELQAVFDSPFDSPDLGATNRRVYDIVAEGYAARGGDPKLGNTNGVLPGRSDLVGGYNGNTFIQGQLDPEGVRYGGGRADIRLAMDNEGELYLLSKSDGAVRQFAAALSPPLLQVAVSNDLANLSWTSVPGRSYRVQHKTALTDANWVDVAGDVIATGISAAKTDALGEAGFYRVVESPAP
jgi:hypothetical protein